MVELVGGGSVIKEPTQFSFGINYAIFKSYGVENVLIK